MGKRIFRISPEIVVEICKTPIAGTPPDFTLEVENGLPADTKIVRWKHVYEDNTLRAILESAEWDDQDPIPEIDSPLVHQRRWPKGDKQ